MKKIGWQILFVLMFLITACAGTAPLPPTTTAAVSNRFTSTPSSTAAATQTPLPSSTPTASITPLPTIPTFTPTFDARTIVTVTPAPKAECPKNDPTIKPEDFLPNKLEYPSPDVTNKILEFLNKGGDGQTLIYKLNQIYSNSESTIGYGFLDVTGDQVPEFLYVEINYAGKPIVLSCQNGKYEMIAKLSGNRDFDFYDMKIDDLNSDGIPEIIITGEIGVSVTGYTTYFYEWNGKTFSIMGQAEIVSLRQTQIKDIDGNGTKEILLIGDNPSCLSCWDLIPQRQRTIAYSWNGKDFVEISNELASPKYRFQAIQDADAIVIVGNYGKAFQLYEKTILDKSLEWWSPERFRYEQARGYSWMPEVTMPPKPVEDKTEYPKLAAYAYFRIVLLHLAQNHEPEATTVYNTLQKKFSNDQYGHPYAEMATAFWEAYQSTHKMYDGCAAAIQYAAEHLEILTPLGSDYHGSQSHMYVPDDVCPFR